MATRNMDTRNMDTVTILKYKIPYIFGAGRDRAMVCGIATVGDDGDDDDDDADDDDDDGDDGDDDDGDDDNGQKRCYAGAGRVVHY